MIKKEADQTKTCHLLNYQVIRNIHRSLTQQTAYSQINKFLRSNKIEDDISFKLKLNTGRIQIQPKTKQIYDSNEQKAKNIHAAGDFIRRET